MKIKDKKVVILFGIPGSGKDTQAKLIGDEFNLDLIETSKIFKEKLKSYQKDPEIKKALENIKKGKLFDPKFAFKIVKEKLEELLKNKNKGFVFNGSPRTLYEADKLLNLLKQLFKIENLKIFYIDISEKEAIRRLSQRLICKKCERPVDPEILQKNPNIKKCPICGGKIIKRQDDKPIIIKKRIKEYKKRTEPILKFLKTKKIKIIKINGEEPIKEVFNEIKSYIK